MLVAVAAWPQHIVTQSAQKELFAVFHADSANDHREPGVVVILEKADWDKLLASVGNPSAGAVDFSTDAVLAVTGRFLGEFCRSTAVKGVAKAGDGRVKVTVEETYPEKCSGGAVCRCSLVAGIPPPVGNTVIALKVQKPVRSAEVETISVIDKCCPAK
jgi:hypothetical protein